MGEPIRSQPVGWRRSAALHLRCLNQNKHTEVRGRGLRSFVTAFFGFVDDMVVEVSCEEQAAPELSSARASVQIQSQLRLGVSDMGVNRRRASRLLDALERTFPLATHDPNFRCSE